MAVFVLIISRFLILEKIKFPLLETVAVDRMATYIPSMLVNLKKIHQIKAQKGEHLSWKDYLLTKFNGDNPKLNWRNIAERKGLDKEIVLGAVEKILKIIGQTDFVSKPNSFLHTDFNQRNLFIDPESDEVMGIIDWGEATFGDPIYDFARIRMLIWHFNLGDEVIDEYYERMNYSIKERKLDDLYWLCRVIEYLAYYSEDLNTFSTNRIKMHQEFLNFFVTARGLEPLTSSMSMKRSSQLS